MKSPGAWVGIVLLAASCARSPLKGPEDALRLSDAPSSLTDDLPLDTLISAMNDEIKVLERDPLGRDLRFGNQVVNRLDYAAALRALVDAANNTHLSSEAFAEMVRKNFDFYDVYGDKSWGDVFMTSYFEPVIQGSLRPTARFSRPLYRAPADMIEVPLDAFSYTKLDSTKTLVGRLVNDRGANARVVPYYSRQELDQGGALANKKLELCWVDPIDAFVLQIQGSGIIEFDQASTVELRKAAQKSPVSKDVAKSSRKSRKLAQRRERAGAVARIPSSLVPNSNRVRVGYAAQNGYPYEAVGSFLKDVIPSDKMSLQSIEAYLRTLPPDRMQEYLNKNPSYVFFKELTVSAVTSFGVAATPGRTIATDSKYFPKGALGFLIFDKPRFATPNDANPASWESSRRFVMDQDKGGAIKGPARLDLFWGSGAEAKQNAGVIKEHGRLYYLAPKETFLAEIRNRPKAPSPAPASTGGLKL